MDDVAWIRTGLQKPGKQKGTLAKAMGIPASAVTSLLKGDRELKLREALAAARYLEVDLPFEMPPTRMARLIGFVGAGAATTLFGEGDELFEEVPAPEGSTESTVAVEVRGESLGQLFDRWLVFYDEVRTPPTTSMFGRLCVVGLADGRILVKQLKRGQLGPPHYNLLSNTEPPIYDAALEWAAVVKQMTPR